MKYRLNGSAAVLEKLPVRIPDGCGHFFVVCVILSAPDFPEFAFGMVCLAAGGVIADVCVRVGFRTMVHAVENIGPGGYRLGFQCLRLKQGGHFSCQNTGKIVCHGVLLDTGIGLDGKGTFRIFAARGNGRGNRWFVRPKCGEQQRKENGGKGGGEKSFHGGSFQKDLTVVHQTVTI